MTAVGKQGVTWGPRVWTPRIGKKEGALMSAVSRAKLRNLK